MTYLEAAELVARERETEQWLRSQDWSEIVMRIHELEDLVDDLDSKLERAVEYLGYSREVILDFVKDQYGEAEGADEDWVGGIDVTLSQIKGKGA
jgi:hypothetical protein